MSETADTYYLAVYSGDEIAGEWEDERADPIVSGRIVLTEDERALLDSRLYALVGEDYIGRYEMEPIAPDEYLSPAVVLSSILEVFEESEQPAIRQLWERYR